MNFPVEGSNARARSRRQDRGEAHGLRARRAAGAEVCRQGGGGRGLAVAGQEKGVGNREIGTLLQRTPQKGKKWPR